MTSRSGFSRSFSVSSRLSAATATGSPPDGCDFVPVEVGLGEQQHGVGREGPDEVAGRVEQGGRLLGEGHHGLRVSGSLADEGSSQLK